MPFVLIRPNDRTPLIELNELLHQQHEMERAARARIREQRKQMQIPLDDKADPRLVIEKAEEILKHAKAYDYDSLRSSASTIWTMTAATISELGEFVKQDSLDGIKVSLRVLSESRRHAFEAKRVGVSGPSVFDVALMHSEIKREYLRETLAQIELEGTVYDVKEQPDVLDILDVSGVLSAIYLAAERFQSMPEKKLLNSGT